jgi:ribonuclease III
VTQWITSSPGSARDLPIHRHSSAPKSHQPPPSGRGGSGDDASVASDAADMPDGTEDAMLHDELVALIGRLDHDFTDTSLLLQAVTHRSWCAEHPGTPSNERLEFLGDAVLGLFVTDFLFHNNPTLPEGQLAKSRAGVVSMVALAGVAAQLGLGGALRLGRGEANSGGREKPSILADALEAVIAAVWIDGGMAAAQPLVVGLLADRMKVAAAGPGGGDFKTRLQEHASRMADALPEYHIVETGPDHAKEFAATVRIAGRQWGAGRGRSKKEAEQAAAADALDQIMAEDNTRVAGGGDN